MEIKIGEKKIGRQYPVYIVAEMSGNHNGDINNAINIIKAAKHAGADAIKLQTYKPETITINCDSNDFLIKDGPWERHKTLWDLYEKAYTPWEWHEQLFYEARSIGLDIFSSPFDETAVDLLESLKVNVYKIASPEITHIPLIRKVAKTGKPIILSKGLADLDDIELAIEEIRKHGGRDIILLQCNSAYPSPLEDSNLLTIPDINERFGVIAGLSDHTIGQTCAVASVALGARVVEKHITIDQDQTTVDSFFSCNEDGFGKLVNSIREVELALGHVTYSMTKSADMYKNGRRSLYAVKNIKQGEIISEENIKCIRPGYGMHPKYYHELIGKRAAREIARGQRLEPDLFY